MKNLASQILVIVSALDAMKTESALYAVMVIASLGAFMLILSIRNDRLNQNSTSPINGLEEAE